MKDFLINVRDSFFKQYGESRLKRIIICTFFICIVWSIADILSGSFQFKLRDDLICLVVGIIAERIIPWGKANVKSNRRICERMLFIQQVDRMSIVIKEQSEIISEMKKQLSKQG